MAADPSANPYVGPRPFEREDAPRFFGRTREIHDAVSLVTAQRVLLLYSSSGAGKSSLLNAGVVPVLEDEKGADVLPVGRVRAEELPMDSPLRNVFVFALLSSLGADSSTAVDTSISAFLQDRPRAGKGPDGGLRVLVIDQLEELFTTHLAHWDQRAGFFGQLRRGLELEPALRVVLSIREEFVAQLDSFATLLPGGLRTRFRLERLQRGAALRAVTGPVELTFRSYAAGTAERLVDDLLKTRVEARVEATKDEALEVEGEFVEPVQLQVVCHRLWSQLPGEVTEITEEDLRAFGDVDQVLTELYEDAVRNAVRSTGVRERRLRRWIDRTLLTTSGLRTPVVEGDEATAGMPNEVLQVLEDGRVVRAERWGTVRLYELTHDRLIRPVQEANARYAARRRSRQQRLAGAGVAVIALFAAGAIVPIVLLGNDKPKSTIVSTDISITTNVTLTQGNTETTLAVTTTIPVTTTVPARTVTTTAPGSTVTVADSTVTETTTETIAQATVTETENQTVTETQTVPASPTSPEPPP